MSSPLGGQPQPPLTQPGLLAGGLQQFTAAWGGWFSTAQKILVATSSSGPTSARPTSGLYVGQFYMDLGLGKPIWLRAIAGPVWVDATGAAV
jgi:hypothetical protein